MYSITKHSAHFTIHRSVYMKHYTIRHDLHIKVNISEGTAHVNKPIGPLVTTAKHSNVGHRWQPVKATTPAEYLP